MPKPKAKRIARSPSTFQPGTAEELKTADRYRGQAGNLNNFQLTKGDVIGERPDGAYVTVKVQAIGLNFADVFACLGLYSATPKGTFTPGLEFAGIVEAVNPEVTEYSVGDRVFGFTRFGGYSSRIHADISYLRPIPEGWSFADAAAFPAQALTAWYGLVELGQIKKGNVVLIQSGAGGTGLWAVKICQMLGAKVVATVGSSSKVDELLRLCPTLKRTQIIDRSECTTKTAIRVALKASLSSLGELGFHVILDSLMGDWYEPSDEVLSPMGRHIVYGAASMTPTGVRTNWVKLAYQWLKRPRLDPLEMISQNKSMMAFNLIWLYEQVEVLEQLFDDVMTSVDKMGKPVVGHVFPFEDMHSALRLLQSGKTVGKVILEVTDDHSAARVAAEGKADL